MLVGSSVLALVTVEDDAKLTIQIIVILDIIKPPSLEAFKEVYRAYSTLDVILSLQSPDPSVCPQ